MKRTSRLLLCILLAAFVFAPAESSAGDEESTQVVVFYFHRTLRCQTCLNIEALARYDVNFNLAEEMEKGILDWRLVNFQEKENTHFAEDFHLEGPSLILAEYAGLRLARWRNLEKVWELSDDPVAFDAYVLGEIRKFLAGETKAD